MVYKAGKLFSVILLITLPFLLASFVPVYAFTFASISDAHVGTSNFTTTLNQIKTLNPNFILFNGDVENDGVVNTQMDPIMNVLGTLLNNTFVVRGNHDDHIAGSATLWQNYFTGKYGATRPLPAGASNYVAMDSAASYLTYSFNYDNSIFIGLDSNTNGDPPTGAQLTFLDQRLTYAEGAGLTHAFIFVHPPEYCVESTHCGCQTTTGCGPSTSIKTSDGKTFVNIINNHPIVSATIHGHEHILAWVHMNSARVSGLTHEYEEFFTSSSGEPYGFTPYPARMDYYNYSDTKTAFGFFDVNGSNFTVNLYQVGPTSPTNPWTKTFTKSGTGGTTPTITPSPTPTPTRTPTPTPRSSTPTPTPASGINSRPLQYYGVDRVASNADFTKLAAWGINSAVVAIDTYSSSSWQSIYNAAHNAGINIIIWPMDQGGDNNCGWESPFNAPVNGNYITKVTAMLDWWANKPGVIGINTFHEPMWSTSSGCKDSVADLSAIYSQIHAYTGNPNFLIFGYINTLNTSTIKTGDPGDGVTDYTGPADLAKFVDVAVLWQHCATTDATKKGVEGPCEGSGSAMSRITEARSLIKSVNSPVKILFLQQTFTTSGYSTKFTPDLFYQYSCDFLNSGALDGFAYYTWSAWWPDLHSWTDLQAKLPDIYNNCVNHSSGGSTPTPTPTPGSINAPTPTPTPSIILGDASVPPDGKVNEADYSTWLGHFGTSVTGGRTAGDFNGDGKVDGVDYSYWLTNYTL